MNQPPPRPLYVIRRLERGGTMFWQDATGCRFTREECLARRWRRQDAAQALADGENVNCRLLGQPAGWQVTPTVYGLNRRRKRETAPPLSAERNQP